jgi:hypothetical protein
VLWSELQVTPRLRKDVQWLLLLLFVLWGARPLQAQTEKDAAFQSRWVSCATQITQDKEAIVERLIQSGHSVREQYQRLPRRPSLHFVTDISGLCSWRSRQKVIRLPWTGRPPDSQGRRQHTADQLTKSEPITVFDGSENHRGSLRTLQSGCCRSTRSRARHAAFAGRSKPSPCCANASTLKRIRM